MELNLENRNERLLSAAQRQKCTTFYDLHIYSPLLDISSQPVRTAAEKKGNTFSIRLPQWIRKRLDEISEKEAESVNHLIKNAVENAIIIHDDRAEAREIFTERPNINLAVQ